MPPRARPRPLTLDRSTALRSNPSNPLFETWQSRESTDEYLESTPEAQDELGTAAPGFGKAKAGDSDTDWYGFEQSSHHAEFSSEACRDWILPQLEEMQISPTSKTLIGDIQEIKNRLLAQFGEDRIEDAMRIALDLIENKRNVTDLAEDGDRNAAW